MRKIWRVYYRKEPTFQTDNNLSVEDLPRTHQFVRSIMAETKDEVYREMQGEVWSPNGEMRSVIIALHLHHTSMSVGDVLELVFPGRSVYVQCASFGWKFVPKHRKPVVQNLGEIVGWFQRITIQEAEELKDAHAFGAPTEANALICNGFDLLRETLTKRASKRTGLPFSEIGKEIVRRSSGKWVHYNLNW